MDFKDMRLGIITCSNAAFLFFYQIAQFTLFSTLCPFLINDLSISVTKLSQLSSGYLYACALTFVPAGWLLDNFPTRNLLVLSATFCTISAWLIVIAQSAELIFISRLLAGISNAFVFLGCIRLASNWFRSNRLSLVIGLIVATAVFGGVISQAPFVLLVETIGWKNAMIIDTMFGIVLVALMLFTIHDNSIKNSNKKIYEFFSDISRAAKNSQNWLCGLYTAFFYLPITLLSALVGNLFLIEGHGFTLKIASSITGQIAFGIMLGAPLIGIITDRSGARRKVMFICGLLALIIIIGILFLANTEISFKLLFFLLGMLSGAEALSYPIITKNNQSDIESTCLSILGIITNLIGASSQMLFGFLMSMNWSKFTHNILTSNLISSSLNQYQIALEILPIAFIINLVVILYIKD